MFSFYFNPKNGAKIYINFNKKYKLKNNVHTIKKEEDR